MLDNGEIQGAPGEYPGCLRQRAGDCRGQWLFTSRYRSIFIASISRDHQLDVTPAHSAPLAHPESERGVLGVPRRPAGLTGAAIPWPGQPPCWRGGRCGRLPRCRCSDASRAAGTVREPGAGAVGWVLQPATRPPRLSLTHTPLNTRTGSGCRSPRGGVQDPEPPWLLTTSPSAWTATSPVSAPCPWPCPPPRLPRAHRPSLT